MKRLSLLGAALAAVAISLAACGGGGGSSGSATVPAGPSATPTPAPAAKTVLFGWRGTMAPGGAVAPQSALRHPMASASSTPIPVLMAPCDPSAELCSYYGQPAPGLGGANVTPVESGVTLQQQPTLTVSPTITVSIPSPAPSSTPVFPFQLIPPATPGTYTATATFPDQTTGTIPVYVYHRVTFGCGPNETTPTLSLSPGYNFDAGAAASTIAGSDVYVTGPGCPAPFTASGSYLLHVPAGWFGNVLSTGLTMANVQPTSWSSQFTSMDLATFGQGSGGQILLIKTAQGHIVKFEWLEEFGGNGGRQGLTGSFWLSSDGVTFSQ